MLFEPDRHEPLRAAAWDETRVRAVIATIAADAEARFDSRTLWPAHPLEDFRDFLPAAKMLYFGAAGVIWTLDYLARRGAVARGRDYTSLIEGLVDGNRRDLQAVSPDAASYLTGDVGILLVGWRLSQAPALADRLAERIRANLDHPSNELMVGAPGTMLAALFLYEDTGAPRWRELFLANVESVWPRWEVQADVGCYLWTQDFMGTRACHLGAVHGFAGNAQPLLRGATLLAAERRAELHRRCAETLERTALVEDDLANWPQSVGTHRPGRTALLLQYCNGAPGVVSALADLPADAASPADRLLRAGGELIWRAGPLRKGPGLCHGTAGNGYAFLKLYRRTGEAAWLERARAFAMHAIGQCQAARDEHGQGRYALWTGDLGLAVYLWQCIDGSGALPAIDVF